MTTPVVRKKKGLSPVWILPIVALCIGGWLLYRGIQDAGIKVTVHFRDASGITPGKSLVMFRGIPVGVVRELHVDKDLRGINMIIEMKRGTRKRLVKDTLFWLVRPEVSAGRIRGLDTLLSGSYIGILPGKSTEPARTFQGLDEPPPIPENAPGLHIKLKAEALHSIQKGSLVFYKNIEVGSVQNYTLAESGGVLISVFIEPKYQKLVRSGSRFWNASGITLSGNITGLKLRMESLAALARGGIAFETPAELMQAPPAENGDVFTLYRDYEAAEYGIPMTLQLASGEGIVEGATKVMYRGLEAGVVTKITINKDPERSVTAHILLDPRARIILRSGTRFWVVRPEVSFSGIRNIDTIIKGSYITFEPGEGPYQDHFMVQALPPPHLVQRPGTRFLLVSDGSTSVSSGSPVYYRRIKVGEVGRVDLAEDARHIDIGVIIYKPYVHLVSKRSVFWNTGGIRVRAGLDGIRADVGTVESIVVGGIAFATPPSGKEQPAETGSRFTLYPSARDAEQAMAWLKPAGLRIRLRTAELGSLQAGSPVFYKKVPIGEVTGFRLARNSRKVLLDCLIQKRYAHLVRTTCRFYNLSGVHIEGGLSGIRIQTGSLKSILAGGIGMLTPGGGKAVGAKAIFRLYENRDQALHAEDLRIEIRLAVTAGIQKGTPIRYRGMDIGDVRRVTFGKGLRTIVAEARVRKEAAGLFREKTRLWVASPAVGLQGVRNLNTIVTGPYIAIAPGGGKPRYAFSALDQPPVERNGLALILETPHLGSLKVGSPVYYRQVQVGRVTGFSLSPTAQQVWVEVVIEAPNGKLVRENTRFWNVSGIRIQGGVFKGIEVSTESLLALVAGGIAMATPDNREMGGPVDPGRHFKLYDKARREWLDWQPSIRLRSGKGGGAVTKEMTPVPKTAG